MKLKICVLGHDMRRAREMLQTLCEHNAEDIAVFQRARGRAVMRDGTELIAKSIADNRCMDGLRFDQIFFENHSPSGWRDIVNHSRMIQMLNCSLRKSEVPPEFQWCEIDV